MWSLEGNWALSGIDTLRKEASECDPSIFCHVGAQHLSPPEDIATKRHRGSRDMASPDSEPSTALIWEFQL